MSDDELIAFFQWLQEPPTFDNGGLSDDELCNLLQHMRAVQDEELRRHQPIVWQAMQDQFARLAAQQRH